MSAHFIEFPGILMFATLVSYTALVASIPILSPPQVTPPHELQVTSLEGFYVDRASYEPGDVIRVCANWPSKHVRYRVLRAGLVPDAAPDQWEPIAFPPEAHAYDYSQVPPYGSFVDLSAWPVLSATGRSNWTIEGWFNPSYIAPSNAPGASHADDRDVVCIAGQLQLDGSGQVQGVGLGIDKTSRLFAAVQTGTNTVSTLATEQAPSLTLNAWHYVALVYDKNVSPSLKLYRFTPEVSTCIELIASANPSGSISTLSTSLPFRIGARAEAPGDMTGCADGRFDRWSAWSAGLTTSKLNYLLVQGLSGSLNCAPSQPPNLNNRQVFLDFEHAYDCQSQALDSAAWHRHGTIVNYGALGVSGAPNTAHGIRLNHDQVIDAKFDVDDPGAPGSAQVASIEIPSICGDEPGEWRSGYYAIQAVFGVESAPSTYTYDPHSEENNAPENFTCFVVRPGDTCPAEPIAVLVPTNTWLAYTFWPGLGGHCAGGLTQRRKPGTPTEEFVQQGDNSVYGKMGDGAVSIFTGWRRPSFYKTSILQANSNNTEASLDGELFEWLEHPVGGIWPDTSIPYSAYADADLDDGTCDLSRHEVLMIIGHSEYWSEAMMNRVKGFLNEGGNLVTIGGNLMAWRSEMFTSACGAASENKVIEVKKWPRNEFLNVPGIPDIESVKDFERTGSWRHILQCRGELGLAEPLVDHRAETRHDDYVLGVAGDITGNGCASTQVGGRGRWRVRDSLHWLWEQPPLQPPVTQEEHLDGVGLVVGEEVDSYVCSEGTLENPGDPCPGPGQFPDTLPAWGSFPFSLAGKVSILADGTDFFLDPTCGYAKVPWCSPKFSVPATNTEILQDCNQVGYFSTPNQAATTDDSHGSIVFYRFATPGPIEDRTGLGYVLTVGSIQSILGLRQEPLANSGLVHNLALSRLVERALKCMVLGDCGTSPPPLFCDQSR